MQMVEARARSVSMDFSENSSMPSIDAQRASAFVMGNLAPVGLHAHYCYYYYYSKMYFERMAR